MRRRRLQTFPTKQNKDFLTTTGNETSTEIHGRKIAYAIKNCTNPNVMGEQYIGIY
jgi:hypothetical protein